MCGRKNEFGAKYAEAPIPDEMMAEALRHRELLLETVADTDDGIMEKYLAEEEIPLAELKTAIRRATINLELVPVYCGAALRNKGIQPLLDGIVDFLPAPVDVPPVAGKHPTSGETETRPPGQRGPLPPWPSRSVWIREGR